MRQLPSAMLIGHISPNGGYPSYVIPVVRTCNRAYAVYASRLAEQRVRLVSVRDFVKHPGVTDAGLWPEPRSASLTRYFAFAPDDVHTYDDYSGGPFWEVASGEKHLLRNNPFAALLVAFDIERRDSVVLALAACIKEIRRSTDNLEVVSRWYETQLEQAADHRDLSLPDDWKLIARELFFLRSDAVIGSRGGWRTTRLVREAFEVRASARYRRRADQTVIARLIERVANMCAEQRMDLEWRVFFEHEVMRRDIGHIAQSLRLPDSFHLEEAFKDIRRLLREATREVSEAVPALSGLDDAETLSAVAEYSSSVQPVALDIVFCLDATSSMTPFIDTARKIVLSFHRKMQDGMMTRGIILDRIRARVIEFRDCFADTSWLRQTDFLVLPANEWVLNSVVSTITASGGGDEPESALEALSVAIGSDWIGKHVKSVLLIVMLTDASAHPLGKGGVKRSADYPEGLATSLSDLQERWSALCRGAPAQIQRLLLLAPDAYPWKEIARTWNDCIHLVSAGGHGLAEAAAEAVIESILSTLE